VLVLGEERVYAAEAKDLVIFTFGNGVPMSLRAAREIENITGWKRAWSICAGCCH